MYKPAAESTTMFGILRRQFSLTRMLRNGKKDENEQGTVQEQIGIPTEDEYFYRKSRRDIERLKQLEQLEKSKGKNSEKDKKTKN
ncbi:hypothetical protein Trydic_g588 [Trypoxylus dichotomus]